MITLQRGLIFNLVTPQPLVVQSLAEGWLRPVVAIPCLSLNLLSNISFICDLGCHLLLLLPYSSPPMSLLLLNNMMRLDINFSMVLQSRVLLALVFLISHHTLHGNMGFFWRYARGKTSFRDELTWNKCVRLVYWGSGYNRIEGWQGFRELLNSGWLQRGWVHWSRELLMWDTPSGEFWESRLICGKAELRCSAMSLSIVVIETNPCCTGWSFSIAFLSIE